MPKPISKLSDEEKKAYDREKKALGSITMALTRELFHSFRGYDNSKDLWKALQKRFEGNSDIKKSKRDLLQKQYECFRFLENESLDDLISRFYHLQTDLNPLNSERRAQEDLRYKTLLSSGSGITLFTGNSAEKDHSNGCGVHACYAYGSGMGSHHQHTSRNPPATTSANQSAIAKIAEDHVALFSSCMLAYENFIGGKLTDPETIEEDFNQVDPDDMEDMDIQWNMAMILRRAKRFLNRTGRKFIGGHSNAKVGFEKSKAKCYKCLNYGDFARECQKDRAPASGFTRPSQGNSHGYNNSNNHNHSQSGTSNALVAQQDESFDWGVHLEDAIIVQTQVGLMAEIMEMMEAEKKEASMADLEESTTAATEEEKEAEEKEASVADKEESTTAVALMAIGEATSSSSELHLDVAYKGLEKRNNEINKLQNEILQLKCTNEKLKNSRFVVEHYESVVRQMNGLGLGTNAIPPPVSRKFVNSLIDFDLTCLDESSDKDDSPKKDESSSKANSTSSEEFVTASEDGSVNTCSEGVVSEELLTEQKVKKNIITNGDNCILIEPDIIETNEKLKRTYIDKRNCFHCGLVGHIFVNCPSKNQGKRPAVSQPAVIPKSPSVKSPKCPKQNVVKPLVKPMVKPKIKSEAKPSVSRKLTQPAVPYVSTSGSTRTGEASTSSPAIVESKSHVPVKKQKRSWTAKSKNSQSPSSNSFKDSSILNSHHDYELKEGTISNRWYVDSGCSWHMTGNMALLQDVKPFRGGYVAFTGEKGGNITCQGVVSNDCVSFDNVNFCEQLKHNLLSVSQMCDKEYSVMFDKSECLILKPGFEVPEDWILMRAPRTNDTYQIDMSVATTTSSVATYDCMPCKKGKQQRKSHKPNLQNSIDTPLELLHMDLFGPISIRSIGGTKDETADILQYLILSLESLCKLKFSRIRSDNGTEFKNNLMELFCLKKGIRHEFSALYTPQQNGVAERKNITLIETARTMLSDAKLPVTFWAEAVNTACHVLNIVLVVKRHNKTCYELINNRLPNLDYLVPFGSPCSLLLQYKDRQSKFLAKAVEGILLGYVANSPCKRVYNIGTRTVEEWFEVDYSKHSIPPEPTGPAWGFDYDALFKSFNLPDLSAVDAVNVYELLGGGDDSSFSTRATVPIITPDSNAASASGTHDSDNSEDVHVVGDDAQANPNTTVGNEAPADPINIESSSSGIQEMRELSTNLDSEIQEPIVPERRVHRNHPTDNIIGDPYAGVQTHHRTITENTSLYTEILDTSVMETCLHAAFVSQLEPKNVKEALADNCWIEAIWVFKCKMDDRHVIVKNKARLVVQGFYQQEGLDYTEVYAPVARIEAIRLFLAYATYVGFKVYQLDVKSAFLYGKIHEEVYVTQPPGFEDPHNINKVYKLDKTLYGLHQAPRAWYETLSRHLLSNGFNRGQIDSTLFIRKAGRDILLVQVYVDDIIFGSTNEGMCREFEQVMKSKFEMSNMGELSFFLGLQVSQREDDIYLHQTKYVQDILSKYKMNDSSTYGTPIPVSHGLHPDKDGKDVDSRLYRGMIRSLMYITASRPDIMFAVCLCSRFQSQPKESHMIAVKRIFRYLKGKPRLGLWYSKQQSFDFKAYTDSDYDGCNLDRKSTSCGCQFLGDRLVSWQCKKQLTDFVSTYYGLNFTGTPLFIDDNATMSITNNPVKHSKTKHIEIRHHFIRDCAEKHLIELVKVHMDDNLADLFTKAFDRSRFELLVNLIGLFNPE
ncbi:hypothetical protein L1987_12608 [Smallanthus sonchifolius]|uniref:Uncharacterized protein n=1 Tax=Smallanthus sonchifolius TaxID=185202 RepID=A0ACB9JET6_9ASTR|nr:hypothetical protein L1987_12608 [Smallanthus sonchifolius]